MTDDMSSEQIGQPQEARTKVPALSVSQVGERTSTIEDALLDGSGGGRTLEIDSPVSMTLGLETLFAQDERVTRTLAELRGALDEQRETLPHTRAEPSERQAQINAEQSRSGEFDPIPKAITGQEPDNIVEARKQLGRIPRQLERIEEVEARYGRMSRKLKSQLLGMMDRESVNDVIENILPRYGITHKQFQQTFPEHYAHYESLLGREGMSLEPRRRHGDPLKGIGKSLRQASQALGRAAMVAPVIPAVGAIVQQAANVEGAYDAETAQDLLENPALLKNPINIAKTLALLAENQPQTVEQQTQESYHSFAMSPIPTNDQVETLFNVASTQPTLVEIATAEELRGYNLSAFPEAQSLTNSLASVQADLESSGFASHVELYFGDGTVMGAVKIDQTPDSGPFFRDYELKSQSRIFTGTGEGEIHVFTPQFSDVGSTVEFFVVDQALRDQMIQLVGRYGLPQETVPPTGAIVPLEIIYIDGQDQPILLQMILDRAAVLNVMPGSEPGQPVAIGPTPIPGNNQPGVEVTPVGRPQDSFNIYVRVTTPEPIVYAKAEETQASYMEQMAVNNLGSFEVTVNGQASRITIYGGSDKTPFTNVDPTLIQQIASSILEGELENGQIINFYNTRDGVFTGNINNLDIVLLSNYDQIDRLTVFGYEPGPEGSVNGVPSDGYFVEPRQNGITVYIWTGSTRQYEYWAELNGFPKENLGELLEVTSISTAMATIKMFANYTDLNNNGRIEDEIMTDIRDRKSRGEMPGSREGELNVGELLPVAIEAAGQMQ